MTKWDDIKDDFDLECNASRSRYFSLKLPAPLNEVLKFAQKKSVRSVLSVSEDVISAINPFLEKRTVWNACKAAVGITKLFVDRSVCYPEEFFSRKDYVAPFNDAFTPLVIDALKGLPYDDIKTMLDDTYIRIINLPTGPTVAWSYSTKSSETSAIHIKGDINDTHAACDYVKHQLWSRVGGNSLVMHLKKRLGPSSISGSPVTFEIDNLFKVRTSQQAKEYSEYLRKPIEAGISRSVMFYGPPGTGKSTLARTLVELLKLRSFRIRVQDLDRLEEDFLFQVLDIFQPSAVILDDFDRASDQTKLLETLEQFKQKVKLVIVTVNDRDRLDQAIMRPGRIDELLLVDHMDEEVVRHVLGSYVEDYEIVKDWPVSFINEYVIRRMYLPPEQAIQTIKELAQRVKKLRSIQDIDDIEQMNNTIQSRKKKQKNQALSRSPNSPYDELDDLLTKK